MHVVVLSDFAQPSGGAQKVAVESARALAAAGASVSFIHTIAGADERLDHPRINRVCLDLPDVWSLPAQAAAARGVWSFAAARKLRAVVAGLDRGQPTALHLHQWSRAFSPAVFPVLQRSRLPLAVTAHDYFIACPNGVYYRFNREEPCGLQPLSLGCIAAACDPRSPAHKAVRVARSLATAAALSRNAYDLVHVSDRGRDTLAQFLPESVRHWRIDNPVSVARGPRAEIAPDASFAYIGRITREKGAVLAAQAARLADAPMTFVGDGPAEAEVRAANPKAKILGWRAKAEIETLLRSKIRAVIAPSLWLETGPLTVYEAAAMGVPAIASDRCGASERVAHGETGLICPPHAPNLAACMLRLSEPGAAAAMGALAYARFWLDPPSPESHARRLLELYEKMCARGR